MSLEKNPVSQLQEYLVKSRNRPEYTFSGHGENFTCHVDAAGKQAIGHGSSKKEAKTEAAWNMLKELYAIERPTSSKEITGYYIGELNNICNIHRIGPPEYIPIGPVNFQFGFKCVLKDVESIGYGSTKQAAKHAAAKGVVESFKNLPPDNAIEQIKVKRIDEEVLMKRVMEKLDQLRSKEETDSNQKSKFESITSHHLFFSNGQSPTALSLCTLDIESLPDPENTFERILSEYSYKAKFMPLRLKKGIENETVIAVQINCLCTSKCICPTFSFMGKGDLEHEAKRNAVLSALNLFSSMAI